ncbi:hypothetical protein [Oceanobacillus timonensis]|uniref:hypothetical protein n=1 Tax=Oceanobacillus timonensis TaxID=1926285 RepID=UPI0009BA2033|nr:hypothetical protein [Oceanobacillus timonensis]
MIKYAIKLHENHKQGHLIFHAVPEEHTNEHIPPSYDDYSWQWYLTNEKGVLGRPIDEHVYESYITSTEQIEYEKYDGMYLYAEYLNKHTQERKRTEFVRLSSDMDEMINLNVPFDKLSIYDEKGAIINE